MNGVHGKSKCIQKAVVSGSAGRTNNYRPYKLYQQYRDSIVKPVAKNFKQEGIRTANIASELNAWLSGRRSSKFAIKVDVEGCEVDLCKFIVHNWPYGVEMRMVLEYSLDINSSTKKYKSFINWLSSRVQDLTYNRSLYHVNTAKFVRSSANMSDIIRFSRGRRRRR